jgi:hypothetical protein
LWPVAVQHGRLNALLLKGQGRGTCAGPAFQPRPLVGSYPLTVPSCVAQGDAALNAWEPLSLTHGVLRRGYDSRGGFGDAAVAQAEAVAADKAMLKIMRATCAAQKYVQTKQTAGPRCRDSFKPLSSLRFCVCVLPMSPPPPPPLPPPPPFFANGEYKLD